MFLLFLALGIFAVWFYIVFAREYLVGRWPEYFGQIHGWEDKLWKNSRQILVARLYGLASILIAIHEGLAAYGFDLTPLLTQLQDFVPEKYRPLIIPLLIPIYMALTSWALGYLRRITTEPLAAKSGEV